MQFAWFWQMLLKAILALTRYLFPLFDSFISEIRKIATNWSESKEILENLESIRSEVEDEKGNNVNNVDNLNNAEKSTTNTESNENVIIIQTESFSSKSFVLKYIVVYGSLNKEEEYEVYSEEEDHFGVSWFMTFQRNGDSLSLYITCSTPSKIDDWSIEVDAEVKLSSEYGKDKVDRKINTITYENNVSENKWDDFLDWDEFKEYLLDGDLKFEVTIKIRKMTGFYEEKLRDFDETNEKCSDVILNVNGVKFYVSRLTLASHSSFFKSMFLGQFDDSKKSEITLSGIDSDDFQKYLEILYFHDPIDESNVEGILLIADMYDTQIVVQKCEKFLINESGKMLKKKLEMAVRYNLKELKNDILCQIDSHDDIRQVLPNNLTDLDHSIMAELLEKALGSC